MSSLHSLARRWLPESMREVLVRGFTLVGVQLAPVPGS
jgi:hypothetical protein